VKLPPEWLRQLGNTGDGVFVVDAAQRIVLWNKGAERLLGYAASEVLHRHCYDVIGGKLRTGRTRCRAGCRVQQCVRRGCLLQNFDLLGTTKDGEKVWLNVTILGLARAGQPLTLHVLRDVTPLERNREMGGDIVRILRSYGALNEAANAHTLRQGTPAAALPERLAALTGRELEVLRLLVRGQSTAAISVRLGISPFTVRNHIRNTLQKTGFHSRTAVVAFALRNHFR